ncbi:MAG: hypothetical protein JNL76_07900, partial [Alphaproteobacteria bacterium]|nr:hypothetical protein [Alphaproteobacteria bacterium]
MPKDTNTNNVGSTNANKLFDIPLHLQPGQINTLAFAQDSISSMRLTPKGELEISFRDGSKVAIADFNELADSVKSCGRDTVIQLSDNTIIYPDQLRDQLAEKGTVDFVGAQADGLMILDEPKAGQILTKNIESGHEYKLNFSLDNVNAAQSGPNLLLTFKDGGVLVLNNYFIAVHSDLPPAMTLADGATIDSNELLTSCKLVEIPNTAESVVASAPQSGLRESVSDVEPAAGEEKSAASGARDVAKAAQPSSVDVANIEPAAGGEGAARVSGSSRGYGFGSSIDGAPFSDANAIGPISPTALNYGAPQISTIPYVAGSVSAAPNDIPTSNGGTAFVDETNIPSVSGAVVIDYGIDGPGTVALNTSFQSDYPITSGGVPVLVSLSGNTYTGLANGAPVFTLTLNASTGAYTFTQLKNIDHANSNDPNDSLGLSFGVTATDRDGDQINTSITIQIRDDGPVAVDDSNFLLENQQSVSGNILTNDDPGADGLGALKTVSFNGQDYPVPATGVLTILGVYGTLQISANGAYSYTSANAGIGVDSFSYVIVDGDGDSSIGRFTLEVRDVDYQPIVVNAEATLDETGIAGDGRESVSGTVAVNFQGDGAGSVDAT